MEYDELLCDKMNMCNSNAIFTYKSYKMEIIKYNQSF